MRTTLLVFGVAFLAAALSPAASLAADRNSTIACQLAQTADESASQDLPTLQGLVEQASSAAAQSSDPGVRQSATMLGRATRQRNPVAIHSALRRFRETCRRTAGATSTQTHAVPEDEFDRQLHDVLQRTGRPNASCEKQHFGEGWAAVCE